MSEQHHDYRGYAGTVAGGTFRPGDDVLVLPSGLTTTIASIDLMEGPVPEAFPPMSVTMRLTDDIDVSRGSMICAPDSPPESGREFEAMVCWMSEMRPMRAGDRLAVKHTTRSARAVVSEITYRIDVNSFTQEAGVGELSLNELGRVRLRTSVPLFYDEYARNRATGSFILVDEATNATVGGGMILGAV
jgi:bifunctional enzyme CysN/CysC